MYLIQSWKDSLSLFRPQNFKLFALVTAKTIGQTYWLLFRYFWWMPVLYGVVEFGSGYLELSLSYVKLIQGLLLLAWTFFTCLAVRPSVMRKTPEYFWHYMGHLPGMIVGEWVVLIFFGIMTAPFSLLLPVLYLMLAFPLLNIVAEATLLFFVFFLLDMPVLLENWSRAIQFSFRMFFYNIFAIILLLGALQAFSVLVHLGFVQFGGSDMYVHIENMYKFLVEPIVVCLLGNFYIKRLHEQPQLYFKQPKE